MCDDWRYISFDERMGTTAITGRTRQLVDEAEEELILVLGEEPIFDERLSARLRAPWITASPS